VLQERERIAQDLHDGSIQSLYAVSLSLEDIEELIAGDQDGAVARIDHAIDQIHGTIAEIRDFITGLDREVGIVDLLDGLAALAGEFEHSTDIPVAMVGEASVRTGPDETVQLIRLTREALSNVARHAHASRVRIRVEELAGGLRLSIIDDGRGFDTAQDRRPGHHGLANMHARAESLGGTLAIESDDEGTRVVFETARHDADRRKESST
jgi:signal transduction histidine kinase